MLFLLPTDLKTSLFTVNQELCPSMLHSGPQSRAKVVCAIGRRARCTCLGSISGSDSGMKMCVPMAFLFYALTFAAAQWVKLYHAEKV